MITLRHNSLCISVEEPDLQRMLWRKVIKNEISVRKLEKMVKELNQVKPNKPIHAKKKSVYILKIEDDLRDKFGTKVLVRSKKEGGSIDI